MPSPSEIWPLWGVRDPVSAGTHFLAFLWAVYVTLLLWRLCRDSRDKQLALGCFGVGMIAVYAASACYHTVLLPPEQLVPFRRMDQCAIYLMIAGSYTPALAVLVSGRSLRRLLLAWMWFLALVGVACTGFLPAPPYALTVFFYFSMAYSGMVILPQLWRTVGWSGLQWLAAGGLFYTIGALVDLIEWPIIHPGVFAYHEFFHVCVMLGTFCHFVFMMRYVVPFPTASEPRSPGAMTIVDSALT